MEQVKSLYQFWGKAFGKSGDPSPVYHLLPYHCLDVAAVGHQLLTRDSSLFRKIIPGNLLIENKNNLDHISGFVSILLALHDIGKFSQRFQNLRPDILKKLQDRTISEGYPVRHDDMGHLILEDDLWPVAWEKNWFGLDPADDSIDWKISLRPWFHAVTGHHGQPPKRPDSGQTTEMLFSEDDRIAAQSFAQACHDIFLKGSKDPVFQFSDQLEESFRSTSWLLAGLTVMSDWIGSNSDYFQPCPASGICIILQSPRYAPDGHPRRHDREREDRGSSHPCTPDDGSRAGRRDFFRVAYNGDSRCDVWPDG